MLDMQHFLSDVPAVSDNQQKKEFGQRLMLAFKQKNISEGIKWHQAMHMHARFRAWEVTIPAALGGGSETVDILNLILSGDIETACLAAMYGVADDMTHARHWLTQARIDWCVQQMKNFLGWP